MASQWKIICRYTTVLNKVYEHYNRSLWNSGHKRMFLSALNCFVHKARNSKPINAFFFSLLLLQSVFSRDDPEWDPKSSRPLQRRGAGGRAEPHPAAAGQRGVPFSGCGHQPAADLQRHPGVNRCSSSTPLGSSFCVFTAEKRLFPQPKRANSTLQDHFLIRTEHKIRVLFVKESRPWSKTFWRTQKWGLTVRLEPEVIHFLLFEAKSWNQDRHFLMAAASFWN